MGGNFRQPIDRRTFLARAAALSSAVSAQLLVGARDRPAWARTHATVLHPEGTTLERTVVTVGEGPYFRLGFGPGEPTTVRDELAAARAGREQRRRVLTAFLHVTDFQLVDAQSPARVEFFDRAADAPVPAVVAAAQRPQEALVSHIVEALVRQARQVQVGPYTGRPLDFTISTGDNIDNAQANEMRWFTTLLNGGTFAANSGAPDVFEGVQSFDDPADYDPHYWHPEPVDDLRGADVYKRTFGYPDYPGLLQAAIAPLVAVGLPHRWYSAYGNHDFLVQGNVQRNDLFDSIARGGTKVLAPPGPSYGDLLRGLEHQDPAAVAAFSAAPARQVTADPERRLLTPAEYIQAHLDAPGPYGPHGHGFTEDNLDPIRLYYTFEVAPGILGITLDTTSPASSEGSIGRTQLEWLEQRLIEVHSRYVDPAGTETTTGNADQLVILFSHHRLDSMQPIQGPGADARIEQRYGGAEVEELLHRFPNVILWVNGHSHYNKIVAHPDPAGRTGGFWDITTSAQIDPPQQARILEIVDNVDGTLSILSTIIDHAGVTDTSVDRYDLEGLAGIGREVAFNDHQADVVAARGTPRDRNVELLIAAPFTLTTPPPPPPVAVADLERTASLPTTGAGVGVAALAAAVSGAVALRSRGGPRRADGAGGQPAGSSGSSQRNGS